MHTMHEHPGRCRGCLVVVATEGISGSTALSPRAATLARASRAEGSRSSVGLRLAVTLRFLISGAKSIYQNSRRHCMVQNHGITTTTEDSENDKLWQRESFT